MTLTMTQSLTTSFYDNVSQSMQLSESTAFTPAGMEAGVPEHLALREALQVSRNVLVMLLVTVGLVSNTLSLAVFLRGRYKQAMSSKYPAALAVSDNLFLSTLFLSWLLEGVMTSAVGCKGVVFVTYVSSFLSVWLTACFTTERYVAVCHPLHARAILNKVPVKAVVAVLVLLGVLLYGCTFWTTVTSTDPQQQKVTCHVNQDLFFVMYIVTWLDSVMTFIFPFLLIIIFNACIALTLWRWHSQKGRSWKVTSALGQCLSCLCCSQGLCQRQSCFCCSQRLCQCRSCLCCSDRLWSLWPRWRQSNESSQCSSSFTSVPSPCDLHPGQEQQTSRESLTCFDVHSDGTSVCGDSRARPPALCLFLESPVRSAASAWHQHSTLLNRRRGSPCERNGRSTTLSRFEVKTTGSLFLVSVIFVLLNLPSHALRLKQLIFVSEGGTHTMMNILLQEAFQLAYYSTFSLNFFLYAINGTYFRQGLRDLGRDLIGCCAAPFSRLRRAYSFPSRP